MDNSAPYIPANKSLPEITIKALVISILLAILLATANTYLALKLGILTSASIPAAVLAMGILKFFKRSNILETNLIQTCASAGEAIAGGVVYTVPALVIIHYWEHFNYLSTVLIALIGGVLGVFFSIPIRRVLMSDKKLHFPEGRAIAEVLKFNLQHAAGFKELLIGGFVGGLVELAQNGVKLVASQIQVWFARGHTLFGFGIGFSATMIGAGYLIGFNVGLSIILGAVISWIMGIPIISTFTHVKTMHINDLVIHLWNTKIRFVGIGAMLTAGLWTLFSLVKPLWQSIHTSMQIFTRRQFVHVFPRTERDIPFSFVLAFILLLALGSLFFLLFSFHAKDFNISNLSFYTLILFSVIYIIIFGFIFSAITGYFSGLVGVSASPGSSIMIASLVIAAFTIRTFLSMQIHLSPKTLQHAAAITIYLGAFIMGAAAIANDNIQDLKVGHLLGSTPWKQQIMLLIGASVAAFIIPAVMNILFNVYGIAGAFPRPGMDPSLQLPAPPAALMATMTQAVFHKNIPWNYIGFGVLVIIIAIIINWFLSRKRYSLSILGLAIGMYLPLSTTTPLFVGSLLSLLTARKIKQRKTKWSSHQIQVREHRGTLLACGLVAGAALMDVLIAIPAALAHKPDVLVLMPKSWRYLSAYLGVITMVLLAFWIYFSVCPYKAKHHKS